MEEQVWMDVEVNPMGIVQENEISPDKQIL